MNVAALFMRTSLRPFASSTPGATFADAPAA